MQFALSGGDPRVHALVVALDRDGVPIAETWRAVANALGSSISRVPAITASAISCGSSG